MPRVLLGAGLLLAGSGLLAQQEDSGDEDRPEKKPAKTVPYKEIRTFADIFARVKQDYVEEVEDKTLMQNAIRGILSGLDPHSAYLDKDEYLNLHEGTTGEFGGLGIEVGMEDGFVKVISPIDDTPAQRAGILAGDVIIRLDNKSVKGMNLDDAVKLMRGKPGEAIEITIVREGEDKPLKFTIVRAVIQVKSVKSRALEPGYIYLRITQFQTHTSALMESAIDRLAAENDDAIEGVVLDLRNNPGGVLSGAIEVSDAFLEEGLIVYTEGRGEGSESRYHAKPGDVVGGVPIVILVNAGSASASEIVAGALQDHKRAIVLGEKTFGKGSVQTILPMNNGDAIKLTTARYYTPSGRSIQATGIQPDIELHSLALAKKGKLGLDPIKESQLAGHLKNGNARDDEQQLARDLSKKKATLAETDYPLFEALNLLKSLAIISQRADSE